MLIGLSIRDFVIIDSLDLDFDGGMTVFTGETGAGKSILVDALSLALGGRAAQAVVRAGRAQTDITAVFSLSGVPKVLELLNLHELRPDGDECVLRRTVRSDGRSQAFVNGVRVALQTLRAVAAPLVDIHGQHAHQSLLSGTSQRSILDEQAGTDALRADCAAIAERYRIVRAKITTNSDSATATDRIDLLDYQIQELDSLNLMPGEVASIMGEQRVLTNAKELMGACRDALNRCVENEGAAVADTLEQTAIDLSKYAQFGPALADAAGLLESAAVQTREAASSLRDFLDGVHSDPQRLSILESRLEILHDVSRKHKVEAETLSDLHDDLRREVETLRAGIDEFADLENELLDLQAEFEQVARSLSDLRGKRARTLERAVSTNMQTLGMSDGRFEISLSRMESATPNPQGWDKVEFLVAANPGQPPRPLAQVASGGELSRISLAIQVETATKKGAQTLIFDEVDVGVGGRVAEIVGRQLRELTRGKQIMCVTHLAQVASLAHHHFQVSKDIDAGRTNTVLQRLDEDARVAEIARMLGGVNIGKKTLAHAKDMLKQAAG